MKLTLLKQKLLYKKEEESADFVAQKRQVLEMKDSLQRAAGFLKAWLEGARAMQKASKDMAESLTGEDQDLEAIANVVSTGLADTRNGAGVVEVALDSINRKIGWLNELKKKCEALDTAHLELSRANRKVEDSKDPAKRASYQADQEKCQNNYSRLKSELEASFTFVLQEAREHSPSGQPHPLGLLYMELAAFKQSQVAFYRACNDVTSQFQLGAPVDISNVWTEFQDRRLAAVEQGVSSIPARAQSGRDLFREGLSGTDSPTNNASSRNVSRSPSNRFVPPPPPPPPPPASYANVKTALYDYSAAGSDELSFQEGARLTILDQSDPNWWLAEDELGNTGQVPSNYLG